MESLRKQLDSLLDDTIQLEATIKDLEQKLDAIISQSEVYIYTTTWVNVQTARSELEALEKQELECETQYGKKRLEILELRQKLRR